MRQRLLIAFGLLIGIPALPWYLMMFVQDPAFRLPRMVALAVIVINALAPLWLRVMPTRAVAWLAVGNLHIAVIVNVLMNQGLAGPNAAIVTCLPVVTAVLLGVSYGWGDGVMVVAAAIALEATVPSELLPVTAPEEIWPLARLISLAIAICLMLVAVTASSNLLRTQAGKLELLAHRDPLTGLYNRHHVTSIMPAEMARLARRRETTGDATLGFVLLDLDHFKDINDTWSHDVGDRVLAAVGRALTEATRQGDVVARWGGDEFLVVLRDVAPPGIEVSARRLLEAVRELRVPLNKKAPSEEEEEAAVETWIGGCDGPAPVAAGSGAEAVASRPRRLRLTSTLGFTCVPLGGSGPVPGTGDGTGDGSGEPRLPEGNWTAYVGLADRALLAAKASDKGGGLGYLWRDRPHSAHQVEAVASGVTNALNEGVLIRQYVAAPRPDDTYPG